MSGALVGVWRCWCTTAAMTRAEIPGVCEHHGARLICEPMSPDRPGPVALGHACSMRENADDSPTARHDPLPQEIQ